jgi:hypothetical protein
LTWESKNEVVKIKENSKMLKKLEKSIDQLFKSGEGALFYTGLFYKQFCFVLQVLFAKRKIVGNLPSYSTY